MISCPSCHKSVEILDKHVGTLFTCPHCSAVYFIDFSGQPEMAQHEVESDVGIEKESPIAFESFAQDQNFQEQQVDNSTNNFSSEQPSELHEHQEFDAASEVETSEEESFDFSQTLDQRPMQTPPEASVSDNSDFSEVTDFANADKTANPLSYVVIIDGIESSRLLHQLKEAMTDSRFGWNVPELLASVGGGRLILSGLTPAKASVFVNRIKYLPFKISWRQDVLSSS